VNTWESYHAVLQAIHASARDVDLVVATGDLAQDHHPRPISTLLMASRVYCALRLVAG
jgi:3',5'-cyclic AMP phosphodiesterase CpdA